jgi:hypothetical protein
MLLENVINPVIVPTSKEMGERGQGGRHVNHLREAIADQSQAIAVLYEIQKQIIDATASDSFRPGATQLRETLRRIVSGVLLDRGVVEYHEEIAEQVLKMFHRRTVALTGLNIGGVDMELIKENPCGCFLQYVSDACGIKTFRELRGALSRSSFVSFAQAREIARSLKLKTKREWINYCASNHKCNDIPSAPEAVYRDDGWAGFDDWLGTGRAAPKHLWLQFPEARMHVHSLGITSQRAWRCYCLSGQKRHDIPSSPHMVYKDEGWLGVSDWLGSTKNIRPFGDARQYVHGLGLASRREWIGYCENGEKPPDMRMPVSS